MKFRNEGELTSHVLKALNQIPGVKAVRRSVGRRGYIKFGETGEADVQGVVAPLGRAFAIELKMPGQEPDPHQVVWAAQVVALGVTYGVATSVQEALEVVLPLIADGRK